MAGRSADLFTDPAAAPRGGIGAHQSGGRGEAVWLTPPELIADLGPFDLDPCFSAPRPWDTAATHYGPDAAGGLGGLFAPWFGRVWCNPPYDHRAAEWLAKCADHGDALALVFARTETHWFFAQVWARASAVHFLAGRLHFHHPDGRRAAANSGAPSALIAYGRGAAEALRDRAPAGMFVDLEALRAGGALKCP